MRHIVIWLCLFWPCLVGAQELTPRYRSGNELSNLNDAVEHLSRILTTRPHPQDLAEMIWSSLPKKKTWKPVAIRADYVREDSDDEFWLEVLDVGRDRCWLTSYFFQKKPQGGYSYSTCMPNISDRLTVEKNFWSAEGATFPPSVKVAEVRSLYERLKIIHKHPEWIKFSPTSEVLYGENNKIVRSRSLVGEKRDAALVCTLSQRWFESPRIGAHFIGETIGENSKILWCDDGVNLWSFLWKNDHGQLVLADYNQADSDQYAEIGKARLCTLPVEVTRLATGGAGNALPISQLQSSSGQLLIRFFRLMKLNNKNECFAYFDAAVSRNQREQWWSDNKDRIASLQLSQILATQQANGQIIVSYPAASGQRAMRCALPNSSRLIIMAVNVVPTVVRAKPILNGGNTRNASRLVDLYPILQKDSEHPFENTRFRRSSWMNLPQLPGEVKQAQALYKLLLQIETDPKERRRLKLVKGFGPLLLPDASADDVLGLITNFSKTKYDPMHALRLGLSSVLPGQQVLWVHVGDDQDLANRISVFLFKEQSGLITLIDAMAFISSSRHEGQGREDVFTRDWCKEFADHYCTIPLPR